MSEEEFDPKKQVFIPQVNLIEKVETVSFDSVEALKADNARLREALEKVIPYAKETHWRGHFGPNGYVCEEKCPPCEAEKALSGEK